MIVIFLIFRGLAGLVLVVVCVPKAIPHFVYSPYGSEAYFNVLFKAYLHKTVHYGLGLSTTLIQSKYAFEASTIGTAKTSGTS